MNNFLIFSIWLFINFYTIIYPSIWTHITKSSLIASPEMPLPEFSMRCVTRPVSKFHLRIARSSLPEAPYVPHGEKQRAVIFLKCPLRILMHLLFSRFHYLISPVFYPVSACEPTWLMHTSENMSPMYMSRFWLSCDMVMQSLLILFQSQPSHLIYWM